MAAAKSKTNPKNEILLALKEDAQFKKFRLIITQVRGVLKLEADRQEVLNLHTSRTSRTLMNAVASAKTIMDAAMRDMSFRSRMVEIRVQVTRNYSVIEEAIKAFRAYMNTEFYDELANYSNIEAKKNMVDRAIKSALELSSECKELIEILDTLIRDIDQSSFGLRNAVDILKLLDDAKGSRNL